MTELVNQRLFRSDFSSLSTAIRERTMDWFERILDDVDENPASHFNWRELSSNERSDLLNDLAVVSGRAIPLSGAWITERRRMSPVDLFPPVNVKGGCTNLIDLLKRRSSWWLGAARNLRRAWREHRNEYADYLVVHTANRYRRHFSAKYMEIAYADLAELLRRDRACIGIYRRSWLLDPSLEVLEPRLTFLRKIPEEHGAEVLLVGSINPESRPEILEFSPYRRMAFERGNYRPSVWAYLWRRKDFLCWADLTEGR